MKPIQITFRSLEKQVCDLKWSRRLYEIGIRQDTFFHWVYDEKNSIWEVCWTDSFENEDEHFAAFTAQDFIDLFPKLFRLARSEREWKFSCEAAYMHTPDEDNMANVFARILITITKNGDDKKRLR